VTSADGLEDFDLRGSIESCRGWRRIRSALHRLSGSGGAAMHQRRRRKAAAEKRRSLFDLLDELGSFSRKGFSVIRESCRFGCHKVEAGKQSVDG